MRGKNFINLTGQRFWKLLIESRALNDKQGRARFNCRCDCGTKTMSSGSDLRQGKAHSCGCVRHDNAIKTGKGNIIPLAKRFWKYVNKDGPMPTVCAKDFGNCWVWTGSADHNGYAK